MDEGRNSQSGERKAGQDAPVGPPAAATDSGEAAELSGTGSTPGIRSANSTPVGLHRTGSARPGSRGVRGCGGAGAWRGLRPDQTGRSAPCRAPRVGHPRAGEIGQRVHRGRRRHRPGQREQHLRRGSAWPVHVISAGKAVGIGLVLTPSGKVLTTAPSRPAEPAVSARSTCCPAKTFKAAVLGTDASAGLALLQLEGTNGQALSTVTVGNSDTLVASTYASKQLADHIPGEVVHRRRHDRHEGRGDHRHRPAAHAGLNQTVTVAGRTRTGPMQLPPAVRVRRRDPRPAGEPDRSGHRHHRGRGGVGLKINGYAMPINQALAIARQIDAQPDGH